MTEFSTDRPTDWRPGQVRNPNGILDTHFTDAAAWEFIASRLEDGHPVEIVELRKPAGSTGYVMRIEIEPSRPKLYVKLQLARLPPQSDKACGAVPGSAGILPA